MYVLKSKTALLFDSAVVVGFVDDVIVVVCTQIGLGHPSQPLGQFSSHGQSIEKIFSLFLQEILRGVIVHVDAHPNSVGGTLISAG